MNTNVRRLGLFFLFAFGIMVLDITYWQVIDASSMQARPDNRRLAIEAARIRRGIIYDRNGTILAGRTVDSQGFVSRTYTDPTLSQVIGYDSPRYGTYELERSYDDYLTGRIAGTSWKTVLDRWEHKPVVGNNLTLTIDDRLQQQVASFLPDTPSAAIVADPRTGNILAMASKPGFDSAQIDKPGYWPSLLTNPGDPLINRPLSGYYPPGSTYKIVTLSAALDSGIMSLSTPFVGQQATGPLTVDSHVIPAASNNLPAGITSVDLLHALMYSDNIVFAQVGLALGAQRFLDYSHRFGIDQPIPFDLPVSVSHALTPGETLDRVSLAVTAFGQGGLHLTPLQMLMVDEAAANDGTIPRPVLVQKVTAPDGTIIKSAQPGTLFTPMSPSTAQQVKQAMVQVVQAGSGFEAQIPGVQVAAKTGTAETGDGRPPHAWFICFAPADHPRIAVVVLVEHGGEGAFVAAPIARRILEAALPLVK
ncbi:MAG: penicillin-binding protein 2 [Chloroflexota bacterium]|nr:penicillin-binding protein 2 [Chloroflexota bacterium]